MHKGLLHIVMLLFPVLSVAQAEKEVWESEKDYLEYKKSDEYKGPVDWYGSNPASMKEEDVAQGGYNSSQGIQYSPQQIQRDRRDRYQGYDRGGGSGTLPYEPELDREKPVEMPDFDPPDVDAPDVDMDAPNFSGGFWKFLMFLLIFAALFIIAYLIIKNRKPSDKKLVVQVENDWNPEIISKTELELRLEEAMAREDYRECVRIYFTFILKELIRKGWIQWKKEKTNYHYVLEMQRRPEAYRFSECVRIYDLVWYGEYFIDRDVFELLRPSLEEYYQSLNPKDE